MMHGQTQIKPYRFFDGGINGCEKRSEDYFLWPLVGFFMETVMTVTQKIMEAYSICGL